MVYYTLEIEKKKKKSQIKIHDVYVGLEMNKNLIALNLSDKKKKSTGQLEMND